MIKTHVVEYGGSVICPKVDENGAPQYSREGANYLLEVMDKFPEDRFIFIVGGGALASKHIAEKEPELREFFGIDSDIPIDDLPYLEGRHLRHSLDYFGIQATHENAKAVIEMLQSQRNGERLCPEVITNPFSDLPLRKSEDHYNAYIAGGFKPGATTDAVAAYFAETVPALTVHKLTNFQFVKDREVWRFNKADQHRYPNLVTTTFEKMGQLSGDPRNMVPGGSYALDPKAVSLYRNIIKRPGMGELKVNIGLMRHLEKMILEDSQQEWTVVKARED